MTALDCIVRVMQAVAESSTEDQYAENLSQLHSSHVWQSNAKLRQYVDRHWIDSDKHKVRCSSGLSAVIELKRCVQGLVTDFECN